MGGSGRSEGEGEGQGPGEGEREEQGEGEGEGQGPGGTVDAQWVGREGGGDDLVGDACECLADAVTEWVTSHAWSPPLTRDVARATWAVVRMTPYSTRGFQATRMLDAVAEGCSKAEALE